MIEYPDFHGDMPIAHSTAKPEPCACGKKCECEKGCDCTTCTCTDCNPKECKCGGNCGCSK